MFTHTHSATVQTPSRSVVGLNVAVTAEGHNERVVTVPDASTDLQIELPIDVTEMKSLVMKATVDMTIETNDGITPTDTIALKAGEVLKWKTGGYFTNPLSADVTDLYVTNASGAEGELYVSVLEDPTP